MVKDVDFSFLILFLRYLIYLVFTSICHEVKKGHVLVAAGFSISYPCQTIELEPQSVPSLSPVHIVAEGQDELQHLPEPFTPLDFLASLQDSLDLWSDLSQENVELLLVMEGSQPLLVVGNPGNRQGLK